jgi:hypothetical protein
MAMNDRELQLRVEPISRPDPSANANGEKPPSGTAGNPEVLPGDEDPNDPGAPGEWTPARIAKFKLALIVSSVQISKRLAGKGNPELQRAYALTPDEIESITEDYIKAVPYDQSGGGWLDRWPKVALVLTLVGVAYPRIELAVAVRKAKREGRVVDVGRSSAAEAARGPAARESGPARDADAADSGRPSPVPNAAESAPATQSLEELKRYYEGS